MYLPAFASSAVGLIVATSNAGAAPCAVAGPYAFTALTSRTSATTAISLISPPLPLHCFGRSLPSASFHILHSSRDSLVSPCLHWTSRAQKFLASSASLRLSRAGFRASTIPSPAVQDPHATTRSTHAPSPRLPHNPHAFHSLSRHPCGSLGKSRSHLHLCAPVFQLS